MRVVTELGARTAPFIDRIWLPAAVDDRLYFAQVREDPRLELEALAPTSDDSLVVVGSGGCTALSLLAAGAGQVTSVDLNRTQNHLIELKVAALTRLPHHTLLAFVGAADCRGADRMDAFAELRAALSPEARFYWDGRRSAIERGALNSGVTERFIRAVVVTLQTFVHRRATIERMLACSSLDEQQELFEHEWDSVRWRALFRLLLNRLVFRKTYDPAFFAHLQRPSFAAHFLSRADYTLTRLSVRDNYFLHHMLTGKYPAHESEGVPPYLTPEGVRQIADARDALTLVDGAVTEYLRSLPDGSVSGFALSNICEWLTPPQIEELFAEVVRTARPNSRLCFRNFVGWTEVPARWKGAVVEDRGLGEQLIARDRSVVQRRIAVCCVKPVARQ